MRSCLFSESMTDVALVSTLRCPACGHAETLAMPTDACLFFHKCAGCDTLLRPTSGDCCVFCSYGSVPCPPIQMGGCCGHVSADAVDSGAENVGGGEAARSTLTARTSASPSPASPACGKHS